MEWLPSLGVAIPIAVIVLIYLDHHWFDPTGDDEG